MSFFFRIPSSPIVFDELIPLYETVGIKHDFGGTTKNVPLRSNGVQQFPLRFNPIDSIHYGTVWVAEGTTVNLDITDPSGRPKTASTTTLTAPVKPTPSRQRFVSASQAPGEGDLGSSTTRGNLSDAISGLLNGDEVELSGGTYFNGDFSFTETDVNIVAKSGDAPAITGRRESAISWTDESDGTFSTTDFDSNMKQVHALVLGVVERVAPYATLVELQAANHGWVIDTGRLYVKLSTDPLSFQVLNPNSTDVFIPDTFGLFGVAFGDRLWVEGITFEFYGAGGGANPRGLRLSTSNNSVVKKCKFRHVMQQGLRVTGSNDLLFDLNTHFDPKNFLTFDQIKNGNSAGNFATEGATLHAISGCNRVTIRNSSYEGQMDCIRIDDDSGGCFEINVNNNTFLEGAGEVIDFFDTGSPGLVQVRRFENILTRCHFGLSLASGFKGPYWFINEGCTELGRIPPIDLADLDEFRFISAATKFNSGVAGTTGQVILINPTFAVTFGDDADFPDSRAWSVEDGIPMGSCFCRNAIFCGFGHPFWDENLEPLGVYDFDHNLYFTTNEYNETTQLWRWRRNSFAPGFAEFQAVSGQESNGEFRDPGLIDGYPISDIPGVFVEGITGNPILKLVKPSKGAQRLI